jgi:hypothetical protein
MAAKEIKIKVEVGDTETVWGKWEGGNTYGFRPSSKV